MDRTLLPELFVQSEGLESEGPVRTTAAADSEDPLLKLFFGEPLSAEAFQEALRRQRAIPPVAVDTDGAATQA